MSASFTLASCGTAAGLRWCPGLSGTGFACSSTMLPAGRPVSGGSSAISVSTGESMASGGLAGWACSLRSGWGACSGAGRWGRNRVRAVTKARIFDAIFSAVGSGADGWSNPDRAQTANTPSISAKEKNVALVSRTIGDSRRSNGPGDRRISSTQVSSWAPAPRPNRADQRPVSASWCPARRRRSAR